MCTQSDLTASHSEAKLVWESYHDEEYRRDQSHWRGHGRWADDKAWQSIGLSTKKLIETLLSLNGSSALGSKSYKFLEWGPGGGSNLFALSRFAEIYYGVDISPSNLEEAQRMINEEGFASLFHPILVSDSPSDVINQINDKVDIFLSTAVFQHFPSKLYGAEVLRVANHCLKPGGLGVIQIRFDNGNPKFKPIENLNSYKERHITANSYGIDEFWDLLKTSSFTPISVVKILTFNNYATYFFKASQSPRSTDLAH